MQAIQWQKRLPKIVVVGAVLGVGSVAFSTLHYNAGAQNTTPPVQPSAQVLNLQSAFEQVADKLRPSVVYIRSRQSAKTAAQADDNPFGFALPQLPNNRQFRVLPPRRGDASGSGVIVSSDGYVMTNDHVVAGSDRVTVRLQDGREFIGKVFRDPKSDLALIKIDAVGLPYAEFADSDNVKIGQWAIAFGSPFGLSDTMTVGVVSSTKRSEQIGVGTDGRLYPSLIQTDASINPGNSGGPLVDIYGRVMGINVAIESPSGGNVGIGFAIPANQARYIMEQLRTKGTVTRGYLGFVPSSLDYEKQQRYGVKQGALVTTVVAGKPAALAGIEVEDVITKFDGKPVADEAGLRDLVARTAPGSKVDVVVKRNGQDKTLNVTVGNAPNELVVKDTPAEPKLRSAGKLGLGLGSASEASVRQDTRLRDSVREGVVITELVPGGPAADAMPSLAVGDIILKINGKTVTTVEQVSEIAGGLKSGARVSVVVRRFLQDGTDETVLSTINLE